MTAPGPWPPEVAHLPVCPHRQLPIPFINEIAPDGTGLFAILDEPQALKCLAGRLCAMCGKPMGWWVAFLGDVLSLEPGGMFIEAPVHERCAEIAAGGLCPYLSRQRVPRRPLPADAATLSTAEDLALVARVEPKRPLALAVVHGYTSEWTPAQTGSAMRVYKPAGVPVRVRMFDYNPAGRLAEVGLAPAAAPRVVRSQPRRHKRGAR